MTTYKEVNLLDGLENVGNNAFNAAALAEIEVHNMTVVRYLSDQLGPIADEIGSLLNDGAGFAVVFNKGSDQCTVIGIVRVEED
jgi:phage-related minor tail protein